MSTLIILLSALLVVTFVALWGLLAMASWSDRQLERAWQEWEKSRSDLSAMTE